MRRFWLLLLFCASSLGWAAGDGLLGNYYNQNNGAYNSRTQPFNGTLVQRIDPQVNFNWGAASPISGVGTDYFTVRWNGEIEFPATGTYRLRTVTDDGVRLFVDWNRDGDFNDTGETVINNWTDHAATTDNSAAYTVSDISVHYPIKMEFYEWGGSARAELYWNTPSSGGYVLIPQTYLYSASRPTITGLSSSCAGNYIDVAFSKTLDSATATTAANYTVSGGITVSAAALLTSNTVRLTTSTLVSGTTYTVSVRNVQDTAGQAVATGASSSFTPTVGSMQPGVLGTYYNQNSTARSYFTGNSYNRVDSTINFSWGATAPMAPVGTDDFTVRWSGFVRPTVSGSYTFYISGDDGLRLYLDGNLIADYWSDHSDSELASTTVTLNAGQDYQISYEMYERSGQAAARLRWTGPGIAYQIVPSGNLYHCVMSATPTAQYQMDESAWSATTGEVVNAISSSYAGRAVNLSTNTAKVCRGANFTSTLTPPAYVSLPVSSPSGSITAYSDFSFGGWVQFASTGDYTILAGTRGSGGSMAHGLWLRRSSTTNWQVYVPEVQTAAVSLSLPATSSNTWYYIGMVRRLASVSLYLYDSNGTLLGAAIGALSGTGAFSVDEMRLGYNAFAAASSTLGSNGRQFYGLMDEVRFYNSALTSTQLSLAAQQTHACPTYGPSAFSISVGAASASTCQPRSVTITALNSSGTTLTGYTGTIAITTSTNHGNWTKSTANGTLIQTVADSGAASYAFVAADNGSIVLNFSNTHADTMTIRVNDATYGVIATSASLAFTNNTFVLTPTTPSSATVPDVIAGRAQTFRVEMWTSGSGACSIATGYTGSKALKSWATVDSAAPAAATLPAVNSVTLPSAVPASNNLTLTFASGVASISLLGTDVGKLSINLRDDSRTYAASSDINGGSSTFIIRPFGFYISGPATATSASSAVYRVAGATFPLTIRAVQYDASDAVDANGDPTAAADLSNNGVVAHFGNETPIQSVDVTPALSLPAGGSPGVLSVSRYSSFSSGSQTQNASYSEVGIINITASSLAGGYLGGGHVIVGYKQNVGRFIPDHFRVAFTAITPGCGSYTYMGQSFNVQANITAENAANETTQNYTGSFALLSLSSAAQLGFTAIDGSAPTALSSRLSVSNFSGSWSAGSADIDDTLILVRGTTPDGVFSQFKLGMAPSDTDNVTVASSMLDLDSDNNASNDSVLLTTAEQRYGRVSMDNMLSSELIPLAVPVRIEYWNETNKSFVTATDDTCSDSQFSITPAASPQWGNFVLSGFQNNLSSGETTPTAFTGFSSGQAYLTLSAPGSGNQGAVTVTAQSPDWLKYDFNSATSGDENPSARATFGLFKERDPVIYWREFYR